VHRVEEITGAIDEGAKVHDLPFTGPHVFDGDHPPHHSDRLPDMRHKFPGHHLAPETGLEQVEQAHADRKPQQLDLVVGVLDRGIFQHRHLEVLVLNRKHTDRTCPDRYPLQIELRLPEQGAFVLLQATEGPQPDQYHQLLLADRNPVDKLVDGAIGSVALALTDDKFNGGSLQVLHMDKSHVDGLANDPGVVQAPVDARQFDRGPLPLRLVEIDPGMVKSAEVVDHRHHEFEGIVRLQVEALEALDGVGGGVGLRKGVAREGFDLPPHLPCQLFGMAHLPAVGKIFLFDLFELPERTVFPRHGAPEHIGFGQVQSGKMVGHFDYILLVHHHAVGFAQLLLHDGMEVGEIVGVVKSPDVLAHHSRFGHTGTDDRTGRHQADVVVAPQLFQQSAHGGALYIKTADGFAVL